MKKQKVKFGEDDQGSGMFVFFASFFNKLWPVSVQGKEFGTQDEAVDDAALKLLQILKDGEYKSFLVSDSSNVTAPSSKKQPPRAAAGATGGKGDISKPDRTPAATNYVSMLAKLCKQKGVDNAVTSITFATSHQEPIEATVEFRNTFKPSPICANRSEAETLAALNALKALGIASTKEESKNMLYELNAKLTKEKPDYKSPDVEGGFISSVTCMVKMNAEGPSKRKAKQNLCERVFKLMKNK